MGQRAPPGGQAPPGARARRARRDPLPAQRDAAARLQPARRDDDPRPPARVPAGELLSLRSWRTGVALYGASARRSRIVIAISEHARETLVERLSLEPDRVRTIHLGVDLERFSPADVPREPFLFYPANAWPHKNHERLFEAVALLRREHRDLRLVLTGEHADVPDFVDARGRVSQDELVELYRRASALVFPSLYEGFGQPVLEALACACPVACSDLPPLREVAGDAAVYFDPLDPESIAAAALEAIARGGSSGPERASALHVGRVRAQARRGLPRADECLSTSRTSRRSPSGTNGCARSRPTPRRSKPRSPLPSRSWRRATRAPSRGCWAIWATRRASSAGPTSRSTTCDGAWTQLPTRPHGSRR